MSDWPEFVYWLLEDVPVRLREGEPTVLPRNIKVRNVQKQQLPPRPEAPAYWSGEALIEGTWVDWVSFTRPLLSAEVVHHAAADLSTLLRDPDPTS